MSRQRKHRHRRRFFNLTALAILAALMVFIIIIYFYQQQGVADPKPFQIHSLKSTYAITTEGKMEIFTNRIVNKHNPQENIEGNIDAEQPEINIIFAGDAMFDWALRPILQKEGYDYPFVYIKDKVEQADYSFVNAETVFTEKTEKDPNQLFWIKSDVKGLDALKKAGFKMLNIGNNHTLDYLRDGLADTLHHVEAAGFDYIGAGRNEQEAYASKEIVIQGKKFRFFSFVRFIPTVDWLAVNDRSGVPNGYDLELVKQTISEQKGDADYTIVYFHWGIEKTNIPADYQRNYVKELKEVGVDLIVGSHPHWLQGFEYYDGMPVAYSLGNFLFPPYVKNETAQTGLLTATFKGENIRLSFDPHMISNGQIIPVEGEERMKFLQYLQSISFDVEITDEGEIIAD